MCYSISKLVAGAHDFKGFPQRIKFLWAVLKRLAPYAAIELILPGGTVLAILLWLYQRRKAASRRSAQQGLVGAANFSAMHALRGPWPTSP
ncbi:MAG TPA: hypothetical protein VMF64_15575 [Steroidobacteraceae bacterium]|nr:hypothetical protein [Steroidobacteraceae bacterium]